jgi:MFS transporter, MHS family, proline/betaine transporter
MTVPAPAASATTAAVRSQHKPLARLVIATSIGNALEWYDIAVYGYFAVYISKAFFPNSDPAISLLLTLGAFALSFVTRPLGGVLLGIYADRHGRKASLMVSILMMTLATLVISFMPAYETIGLWAPIAVLIARLAQGFSAGGEFGSSTAFLVEHMPERRGFIASWQFASQGLANLFASAFGVGLTLWMTPADLQSWGWRIPFLFGALVGPAGLYIRNHLEDATAPPAQKAGSPIRQVLLYQKLRVLLGIGALAISTAINYLILYMPTYAVKTLNLPASVGFVATFVGGIVVTFVTPLAGMASDRIGRTTHMITINGLMLISIFPAFLLLTKIPTATIIVVVVFWIAALKSLYYGPLAALMAELLPPETRATGLGLGYNIGVMIFGGMGPVTMAWLGGYSVIGDLAPGYYLTAIGIVSLAALIVIRRTAADAM